jgi:hypothetical protein
MKALRCKSVINYLNENCTLILLKNIVMYRKDNFVLWIVGSALFSGFVAIGYLLSNI